MAQYQVCLDEWPHDLESCCSYNILWFRFSILMQGCCVHANFLSSYSVYFWEVIAEFPTLVLGSFTFLLKSWRSYGCSVIRHNLRLVLVAFYHKEGSFLLGILHLEVSLDSLVVEWPVQLCFDWYLYLFVLLCTPCHVFMLLRGFLLDGGC